MHIGDYVIIEDDCIVNAAQIGSYVHIGKGAIIVKFKLIFILKILEDHCLKGTTISS